MSTSSTKTSSEVDMKRVANSNDGSESLPRNKEVLEAVLDEKVITPQGACPADWDETISTSSTKTSSEVDMKRVTNSNDGSESGPRNKEVLEAVLGEKVITPQGACSADWDETLSTGNWNSVITALENSRNWDKASEGRTPLHALASNKNLDLPSSLDTYSHITDFMMNGQNLEFLLEKDKQGFVPFQQEFQKWMEQEQKQKKLPKKIIFALIVLSNITDKLDSGQSEDFIPAEINKSESKRKEMYTSLLSSVRSISNNMIDKPDNEDIIQAYLKRLNNENGGNYKSHGNYATFFQTFIQKLIHLEYDHRNFAFDCTFVKKVMLVPDSLGDWLGEMLISDSPTLKQTSVSGITTLKQKAVKYLIHLSTLLSDESKRMEKSGKEIDAQACHKDFQKRMLGINGLMTSFLTLKKQDIRDLASTQLISNGKYIKFTPQPCC